MLNLLALSALATFQASLTLKDIVPSGTHPTFVVGRLEFLEGPVWMPDNHLLFSDIKGDTIYKLIDGRAVPFIKPSHRAIGNALDPQGRLVSCHQESRSVTRREPNGSETVLADHFEGKRFNSPDDLVVRSDGTIYFTDPSFGLKESDRELPFDGVYKISPEGKVEVLLKDFNKPNGLAFSPNEKLLYINDTVKRQIRVFDVAPSGALSNGKLFALITGEMSGEANGMKVDALGNVYCTAPGGIQIFSSDGKYIGLIFMREAVSNFCFGSYDAKTLFITAGSSIFQLRVNVPGAPRRSATRRAVSASAQGG